MQFTNLITGETVHPADWQLALRPGDLYRIDRPMLGALAADMQGVIDLMDDITIYGEILNAEGCEEGFFNVYAYSALSPVGEEGILCILDPTARISRAEFEAARAAGWTQ
ncbi:MAG TPA: hypothetical protein PLV64_22420 [Anaerolineales bacterium]|nr:hypothetical protein [Anaerolineales bacterium]